MEGALSRRQFISIVFGGAVVAASGARLRARLTPLQVAYAGSMAAVMTGALRQAARLQGWDLLGRAQGATALAELIVGGALRPDVFLSITPGPMQRVLQAGQARHSVPFARTAMTLAYDPRGRWAEQLQRDPWWQVVQQPDFRLGRSDPRTDPQGRNIIYTCLLAESFYHQPGLAHRLLGPWLNPAQIFSESTLEVRLQSGQLDAAAAYRFQPSAYSLAALPLPEAINLAALPAAARHLKLNFNSHTYRPEPLVFYAAALDAAPHPAAAQAFVRWLGQSPAQTIFQQAGYGHV